MKATSLKNIRLGGLVLVPSGGSSDGSVWAMRATHLLAEGDKPEDSPRALVWLTESKGIKPFVFQEINIGTFDGMIGLDVGNCVIEPIIDGDAIEISRGCNDRQGVLIAYEDDIYIGCELNSKHGGKYNILVNVATGVDLADENEEAKVIAKGIAIKKWKIVRKTSADPQDIYVHHAADKKTGFFSSTGT